MNKNADIRMLTDIVNNEAKDPMKFRVEVRKDDTGSVIGVHAYWDVPSDEIDQAGKEIMTLIEIYETGDIYD